MALRKNPKVDLRRKYNRTLEISMIIVLSMFIAAFKYLPKIETVEIFEVAPQELITMEEVEQTRQDAAPPPPPKPPVPIEAPTDELLVDIEISATDLVENDLIDRIPPPPVDDEEEEVVPDFFAVVEQQPEPIGGIAAIQSKIKYPEIARRAGVHGMVQVMAYVNELGEVVKVELVKGIGAGCDEEAIKAVMDTEFIPGKQRGRPVKVKMGIPVRFTLK